MKRRLSYKDFVGGFVRLIRWPNLLMIAVTQYMTRLLLVGPVSQEVLTERAILLITLSTVFIAAAGYIINDYFDVKIDLINKPHRVIIGRYLKRRWAITAHQVLSVIGCFLGLWVSKWIFLVGVVSVTLLWFYASYFKKRPFIGNVIVAFLTALSLLIISVYYLQNRTLVLIYALFVFAISLIREVIKDMEDLRGDVSHGCRTLPIVWGIRRTKVLLYGLLMMFIVLLYLSATYLQNPHLAWIFTAMMLPVGWLTYKLVYADTKRAFASLSTFCKIIMLLGMLSMLWV